MSQFHRARMISYYRSIVSTAYRGRNYEIQRLFSMG